MVDAILANFGCSQEVVLGGRLRSRVILESKVQPAIAAFLAITLGRKSLEPCAGKLARAALRRTVTGNSHSHPIRFLYRPLEAWVLPRQAEIVVIIKQSFDFVQLRYSAGSGGVQERAGNLAPNSTRTKRLRKLTHDPLQKTAFRVHRAGLQCRSPGRDH